MTAIQITIQRAVMFWALTLPIAVLILRSVSYGGPL